jgi:hypothetical protein
MDALEWRGLLNDALARTRAHYEKYRDGDRLRAFPLFRVGLSGSLGEALLLAHIDRHVELLRTDCETLSDAPTPANIRVTERSIDPTGRETEQTAMCLEKEGGAPAIRKFPTPDEATWDNVSIRFTGDLAVQITVSDVSEARNYVEMGFEDRRKKASGSTMYDSSWGLLREFAKQGGVIARPQQAHARDWRCVEKGVQAINRKLRALVNIAGNPIQYHRREKRYRAALRLEFPGAEQL